MTTLREAAQMALDALEHGLPTIEDFGDKEQIQIQHKAISALYEALRAALAQPEQEPVAWVDNRIHGWPDCVVMEPDAPHTSPLYTAPPQRKFIGLTDEEIEDACWTEVDQRMRSFARAIEAKLREKNHG